MSTNPKKKPSFRETFIAVGQDTLDKQRQQRQLIISVAPMITGLMIIAGVLYFLSPYASIVALMIALIVLWGRWVLQRQARGDMHDMAQAKKAYERGEQKTECVEFIRLRSAQMLADNKMLSLYAKEQIQWYQEWAAKRS